MNFNILSRRSKGVVEDGGGGGSKAPQFRHACPLYDRCGIADCGIGDVHATCCARYPFLKHEIEISKENQAQK